MHCEAKGDKRKEIFPFLGGKKTSVPPRYRTPCSPAKGGKKKTPPSSERKRKGHEPFLPLSTTSHGYGEKKNLVGWLYGKKKKSSAPDRGYPRYGVLLF